MQKNRSRIAPVAIAAAALMLTGAAVGCGSSSSSSSTSTSTAAQGGGAGTVNVALSEMKIVPAPTSGKAGSVSFDVKNNGQLPHEMVVIKTDKPAGSLGKGTTVPETGSIGETGDIAAGQSKTLTLNMAKGHYALICNLPGHYVAGMYADFNVS